MVGENVERASSEPLNLAGSEIQRLFVFGTRGETWFERCLRIFDTRFMMENVFL